MQDYLNSLINPNHWFIKPEVTFLNHGSFGATPKPVLDFQTDLRRNMETELVDFYVRDLEEMIDSNRRAISNFLNADPDSLAFVPNATHGVNTVIKSFPFPKHGNAVMSEHIYNACGNALERRLESEDFEIRICPLPFPFSNLAEWIDNYVELCDEQTALVMLDHITSPSAVIQPIEQTIKAIKDKSPQAAILVDAAHAPGSIPVSLGKLDVDFYTANLHKWMFTPKSSGILYVRSTEYRKVIKPLVTSHGANSSRNDKSPFHLEFDWLGTLDVTPHLTIQFCIDWIEKEVDGGWKTLMARNHDLVFKAREYLCNQWEVELPTPKESLAAMATIPLPESLHHFPKSGPIQLPGLQEKLRSEFQIEVPVTQLRNGSVPWIRISAQAYNKFEDYTRLAQSILKLVP